MASPLMTIPNDRFCTLDDVARELGVSPERARQIEARALRKLRDALLRAGITADELDGEPEPHVYREQHQR